MILRRILPCINQGINDMSLRELSASAAKKIDNKSICNEELAMGGCSTQLHHLPAVVQVFSCPAYGDPPVSQKQE